MKYIFTMFIAGVFMLASKGLAADFFKMGSDNVRKMLNEKFLSIEAEQPAVFNVANMTIENEGRNTPIRIYKPNDKKNLPIILYIHGGAWVAGNLDTHDNLARYLCKGAESIVVSVGYLNAPEGKFPFALEQCYDALLWTASHAADFQTTASRLAVVGDSAGGNMAAAVCILARDRKGPSIDLQVLINPVLDNTWGGTLQVKGDEYDSERFIAAQYVKDPKETFNPLVSPVFAKDLKGLPPALIILAEKDMFREGAKKYADMLIGAGIPTNVYMQAAVGHLAGNGARASIMAQESLNVAVAALRGVFTRNANYKSP